MLRAVSDDIAAYRKAFKCSVIGALLSPGLILMLTYRLARAALNVPIIGKLLGYLLLWVQRILFASEVNPRSKISGTAIFPHPLGIVIGEGVRLEGIVTVYQGVTVGTYGRRGYPELRHGATLGVNCVVLGDVTIEENRTVRAGSVER